MQSIKEFQPKMEEKIINADKIFISPHVRCDYDALASSIGMTKIAQTYNKNTYLVLDEINSIDNGIKTILNEVKSSIDILCGKELETELGNNNLLIALDTNKKYLIACQEFLDKFRNIIVIDHHNEDEDSLDSDCKLIDLTVSSTAELITRLILKKYPQIEIDSRLAEYLLTGIYLDTNKLTLNNVNKKTFKIASELMEKGAKLSQVMTFFEEDYYGDRKIQGLVNNSEFYSSIVYTCGNDDVIYSCEEIAKAANYLLKYKGIIASFAVGRISPEIISISARSKGIINANDVISRIPGLGGGNAFAAASKIESNNISEVKTNLERVLKL